MRLANGIVAFEFDRKTGSLVGLEHRRARVRHRFDPAYGRLFRVCAPDEERWIDRYADSHESGRPRMLLARGRLTIRYPDLKTPEHVSTGIAVIVTVTLPEGADEARFTIEVRNGGPFLIHEVRFPWIGGWPGSAGPGRDMVTAGQCQFDPHAMHDRGGAFGRGWTIHGQHRRTAPNHINMMVPFLDLSGGGRGFSVVPYPAGPSLQNAVIEDLNPHPGDARIGAAWLHHAALAPGQRWTSDVIGIAPHAGDWHATADRLSRWLAAWWRPPPTPVRLRQSIGFHNALFRDFCGREWRSYAELPAIVRHGQTLGLQDFCIWDMTMMGVYTRAGREATLTDRPERLALLRRVLHEAAAMGVNTSTLINTRLVTMKNRLGGELWERWGARTLYGQPTMESYPIRGAHGRLASDYLDESGRRLCQCHPDFQEWAIDTVARAQDLGFTSMFLDEPFGEDLCFAADHGHGVPGHSARGVAEWTARASELVRARHPDAYTIGESLDIHTTRGINLGWYWNWSDGHGNIFRYTLPDALQAWTIDAYEHEDEVGKAFAWGFLLAIIVKGLEGTLRDVPDFGRRVRRLAALRKRTAGFTVAGRFLDSMGLELDSDASVASGLYATRSRMGIVLGETSRRESRGGGSVSVKLDLAPHGAAKPRLAILHREDGSRKALRVTRRGSTLRLETKLRKWECGVIEVVTTSSCPGDA
ncbi:MAG: hypothetical protein K8T26_17555 [Lentisphaerae bacterium]|nr:hypothetical protein [Lentisphaerota bacterium]